MKNFKWISNLIKALFYEKAKAFWTGSLSTFPVWCGVFFGKLSLVEYPILFYIAKGVGTVALTFICGLASALAKDRFDYWKANRKIKRQRKNQQSKTEQHEYKQIWGKNGKDTNGDHKNTA